MYSAIEYYNFRATIFSEAKTTGVLVDAVTANYLLQDYKCFSQKPDSVDPHVNIPEGKYIMKIEKQSDDMFKRKCVILRDPQTNITESIEVLAYLKNLADKNKQYCIASNFYGFHPCYLGILVDKDLYDKVL